MVEHKKLSSSSFKQPSRHKHLNDAMRCAYSRITGHLYRAPLPW